MIADEGVRADDGVFADMAGTGDIGAGVDGAEVADGGMMADGGVSIDGDAEPDGGIRGEYDAGFNMNTVLEGRGGGECGVGVDKVDVGFSLNVMVGEEPLEYLFFTILVE
jgi:hypothetical protein